MKQNIQKEVTKELIRQCELINADYRKELPYYKENDEKGEIAIIAIKTMLPLADLILNIQSALGYEVMSKWLTQSLKGAHIDAYLSSIEQSFALPKWRQLVMAQQFADLTTGQAKYGEIIGMDSKQDSERFIKAVEENVLAYYLENFCTFYSIIKVVDEYEPGNDWFSTTAIGVHMHVVYMTAKQLGYEADVPVLVLN